MIKYIVTILCSVLTLFVYGQEIPLWVSLPVYGEYIGISLPNGGEKQAIAIALFSYVLGHDIDCSYTSKAYVTGHNINNGQTEECSKASTFAYSGIIKYEVVRKTILNSGETVVAIKIGDTYTDSFKIYIQHDTNISSNINYTSCEDVLKVCVRLSDMLWVLTIDDKTDSPLQITSEYEDVEKHHVNLYPENNKLYQYKFTNSTELGKRESSLEMPLCCIAETNNQIPLGINLINSLCLLLQYGSDSTSVQVDGKCVEDRNMYSQKVMLKNRKATPILGFLQRDKTHFLLLSQLN